MLLKTLILAVVIASVSTCGAHITTQRSPMGPHHAGPNAWHLQDSEKRQAFCYAEVLKVVKSIKRPLVDADIAVVRAMWFDCMNQNGGVI